MVSEGINVLSLFDGMSCGQIALQRAGIKVNQYYAAEIDKYAIQVTQKNFPNTIQLGSVVKINAKTIYLSEVYLYLCEKYFNNDIQSLQSIISERQMLHRINKEQSFSAYFGTQEPHENSQTDTTISINDRIWFWKCGVGDNKGIYDIIRSGDRGKKNDCIDVGQMCKHSFWWNGDRQQEHGIENACIEGVNGEEGKRENKGVITEISNKTIFNTEGEKPHEGESVGAIQEPNKEEELFRCNGKNRHHKEDEKKVEYGIEKKGSKVYSNEGIISTINEIDNARETDRLFIPIHNEAQVTIIECEWGVILFMGVFSITIGGSPCQGFSFAGKGLNFEDPRSKLFFEFVRLVQECKPKHFLLENVKMKKEHELVISQYMNVAPIEINSALVSAQNRVRLYWTNISNEPYGLFGDMTCTIPQPKDKGILLKDILESDVPEKYYIYDTAIARINRKGYSQPQINPAKTGALSSRNGCSHDNFVLQIDVNGKVKPNQDKASCFTAGGNSGGNHSDMTYICVDTNGREDKFKTGTIPSTYHKGPDNYSSRPYIKTVTQLNPSTESNGCQPYQQNRVYDTDGISPALMSQMNCGSHAISHGESIRRLTPTECERLQTVPDGYTDCVSDTQRYRMLGNGFTIDVIAHIISFAK